MVQYKKNGQWVKFPLCRVLVEPDKGEILYIHPSLVVDGRYKGQIEVLCVGPIRTIKALEAAIQTGIEGLLDDDIPDWVWDVDGAGTTGFMFNESNRAF